jgi:hypothetical protein
MSAQTIARVTYRTGKVDRSAALGLAFLLLAAAPGLVWASGPFVWPWGACACALAVFGAAGAFVWWRRASLCVSWDPQRSELEFLRPRRGLDLGDVKKIEVRPAQMATVLWEGSKSYRISHRLVGFETLLDTLRERRPELFPLPESDAAFRVSQVSTLTSLALGALTLAAGVVLAPWVWGWGWVFGAGALLVWIRVLFVMPRSYLVGAGTLTVKYWFGRRTYRGVTSFRETSYAAAGALFFRLRLEFGRRTVVLDEGQLLDPLRPHSTWVLARLGFSPSD